MLSNIIGATIQSVNGLTNGSDSITFVTDKGTLRLYHSQSCCESVCVEDFNGDVSDLTGGIVSVAEERVCHEGERGDYRTRWTFYTIRTHKGDLDIRWLGKDNGYYSVSVYTDWTMVGEEMKEIDW
jgi:hypothetical protein